MNTGENSQSVVPFGATEPTVAETAIIEAGYVVLKFKRQQLLYDIQNYAYIESDIIGDDNQHAKHVTADVGAVGNIDRVNRILGVLHWQVIEMLYPWTKRAPVTGEISDELEEPDEYVIVLTVPEGVSSTTLNLLSKLIHEYMVYRALSDWLSMTNATASANWLMKANETAAEIERTKIKHRHALTRKIGPF